MDLKRTSYAGCVTPDKCGKARPFAFSFQPMVLRYRGLRAYRGPKRKQQYGCDLGGLSSPFSKIFPLFTPTPNHFTYSRRPVPPEGRLAIVTDAGRDAVDVDVPITNGMEADGEGRVVLTPRRWRQVGEIIFASDGDNKARSPGRSRYKPVNHCVGMPGDLGELAVNTRVHTHYPMRTRGCGCAWHPAFPTPSFRRERTIHAPLGRNAPREGRGVFDDRAIISVVVPANAGTHNHRCPLKRKPTATVQKREAAAYGSPAFAGTTLRVYSRVPADDGRYLKTPCSRHRSPGNPRYGTTTPCSSDTPRCRRNRWARRTAASGSAASHWRRIFRWP